MADRALQPSSVEAPPPTSAGLTQTSSPTCNKSPKQVTVPTSLQISPNLDSLSSLDASSDDMQGSHLDYYYGTRELLRGTEISATTPPPVPKPKEDPIPPEVQQRLEQASITTDDDVRNLIREYSKDSSLTQSLKNHICQFIHTRRFGRHRERETEQLKKNLEKEGFDISYSNVTDPETGKKMLGCEHYPRNCKLKAACCNIWVVCRQCHDRDEMDHTMPRHDTELVMCMKCNLVQPVARACTRCKEDFAAYFCDICKFYDNTPGKSIYHCDKCKICRVGLGIGKDNFHCDKCDACVSLDYRENHRCLEKSLDANCPICGQYLYTSTKPVVFMKCGHTMHSHCFDAYTAEHYTCPLCHKALTNMKPYYRQIEHELERHEMPDEHKNMLSEILCHDCEKRSYAKYHYVYHRCDYCDSYNTTQIKIFRPGEASSSDVTRPDDQGEASGASSTAMVANPNECRPETDDRGIRSNIEREFVPVGGVGNDSRDET